MAGSTALAVPGLSYSYHIMHRGAPAGDDYDFWDDNGGLNYYRELKHDN